MRRYSSAMIRNLSGKDKTSRPLLSFLNQTLISPSSSSAAAKTSSLSLFSSKTLFAIAAAAAFDPPHHSSLIRRSFCSPPGPLNIVVIDSEETFNESLREVQDEALPGIFYFTAAWCGPCRFMAPVLKKLSAIYPHVTTYKIDIDQEALGKKLSELSITSVPTLLFFKDGKKASKLVGFDVEPLKQILAKLYE